MSSSLLKRLHRNTALDLTLKFALLFFLSALVLFVTVNALISQVQQQKDQQLINSFLESYQRLELSAGLHKLEVVVERDTPYFQRTEMWLTLVDATDTPLLRVQPQSWPVPAIPSLSALEDGRWLEVRLPQSRIDLMVGQITLSDGLRLRIGKSMAGRTQALAETRTIMLGVMLPLFVFGLLLTYYMNWRALRQVNDLIQTVRSLSGNDLEARVPVRNPRSELGELAQLFNAKLSQIERLIVGMQHSLDAVAHDLRTPLARMRLSIEAAVAQPDESVLREALLDCAEESARIENMLKTLMDISEAQSGILKLHVEQVDLSELISDCTELYRYTAEDRDIRLQLQSKDSLALKADKVRLHQVFGNLIDNAIKYSQPGGAVNIRWEDGSSQVMIEIEDQGVGIDPAEQDRVFDRLYRGDSSRSEPGMGLGLSLVRAIVEAHRGSIEMKSALGEGCTLTVLLPKGE
ncbi:sensor histidine kinase [Motiliproteus sp.]|uniref:sensor histidine kinase n=1 Tax=Motiliproteus sp. TaxID=1898955 RepID=UPI003BAB4898